MPGRRMTEKATSGNWTVAASIVQNPRTRLSVHWLAGLSLCGNISAKVV